MIKFLTEQLGAALAEFTGTTRLYELTTGQGRPAADALLWRGRSTVRTLCAGTALTIAGTPLAQLGDAPAFTSSVSRAST